MALTMRYRWTDERLVDLNTKVDDGFRRMDERFVQVDQRFAQVDQKFAQVDQRFDRLDQKIDALFGRLDGRIDSFAKATMYGAFTLSGVMVAGFVAILTQL